jgi:pimeloyl-ACP methyl ester carboxylesterase
MWLEDRAPRAPEAFRAGPLGALDCFGALPPLSDGPRGPGRWSAPSPRAQAGDDRMAVVWFPAAGRSRGTALLVPPWKTESPRLVSGWISVLARAGRDVWLVVPPHHLDRTAAGARSGEGFISLDLARLRRTFEQLVVEVRMLAALAARRGPVDVVGLSLGGLAATLAAPVLPEVSRIAAVAPPADLAAVLGETAIGRRYRALADRAGAPLPPAATLRETLGAFDPARLPRPSADLFLAVGAHDAIALPQGALALARTWGAQARCYSRGHLTLLFACRAVRSDLARFLAAPRRRATVESAAGHAVPGVAPA